MKDKISVIVPVYNVKDYVTKALDSLRVQETDDRFELEVIIIDDGSTDESFSKVVQYIEKYQLSDQFKCYQQANAGLGPARNAGLKYATGNYIAYLDSDDYYATNAMHILYQVMIANQADIAIANYQFVYPHETLKNKFFGFIDNKANEKHETCYEVDKWAIIDYKYSAWAKLYKRSLIDEQTWFNRIHEDIAGYKILLKAKKVASTSQVLYYYYQRPDTLNRSFTAQNYLDIEANYHDVIKKVAKRYKEKLQFKMLTGIIFAINQMDIKRKQKRKLINQYCEKYFKVINDENINSLSMMKRLYIKRYIK